MPPYNPANDFYFRQSQINFPPQNMPNVNCRFVTNREEARASMIDGYSYNIYLDTGSGKIYLKKLNNNGVADFLTYTLEAEKTTDPISEINSRLQKIEQYIGGLKNESVSNVQQSAAVPYTAVAKQNEPNDEAKPTGLPENAGNDFWKKRK